MRDSISGPSLADASRHELTRREEFCIEKRSAHTAVVGSSPRNFLVDRNERSNRCGKRDVKGKRWLLLTRWMNLDSQRRQQLNELFALNRRVMKAYLL